jgi:hypothetical protein
MQTAELGRRQLARLVIGRITATLMTHVNDQPLWMLAAPPHQSNAGYNGLAEYMRDCFGLNMSYFSLTQYARQWRLIEALLPECPDIAERLLVYPNDAVNSAVNERNARLAEGQDFGADAVLAYLEEPAGLESYTAQALEAARAMRRKTKAKASTISYVADLPFEELKKELLSQGAKPTDSVVIIVHCKIGETPDVQSELP